jgi:hypothetical protein
VKNEKLFWRAMEGFNNVRVNIQFIRVMQELKSKVQIYKGEKENCATQVGSVSLENGVGSMKIVIYSILCHTSWKRVSREWCWVNKIVILF